MELSELIFKSNTADLERVSKVIGDLVTDITQLDKVSRDAAKTEATLAKAAKDHASAQEASRKSVEATESAQRKATATTEKNTSILQRQADIYDFLAQGYSKGQAGILATAKATGQYSKELEEVLKLQKQFTADPFDRSDMALNRMIRSLKELKDAQSFTNQGMSLTTKQARELSNDLARLEASLKRQGKSYDEISKAQARHKQQFVEEAAALNRSQSAMDAVEKQRKEVVTATNYLTQADAKMTAALNISNAALDKAGTDSLVKYETALRKSGVSQDVATAKLATYKAQLTQVNALEQKRREQHLARALSPQLTDIGVSLYSGQAPLTVLLQQGGQIADLLRLSGVEAQNFGKALRDAFASMIPVMATVAKGLGSFTFGLFYDAGKGITNFIANVTGMNKVLQHTDDILYLVGGRATWFSKILATLGTIASVTFGTGILAIVAGLASLAVGLKQVITENNDLAKAFALSGASTGLSHTQMIGYVKTLADSGATTGQATEALIAMAKAGSFTSNEILLVSDSAIQMQKGFGIAIEDTVKQFAKLKEKPVEALLEIAKSSGMVGPEVIKMVQELEKAGRSTDAASVAMKAYADVTKQQVAQMKENYNGFALFMIDLGQKIKQFFSDTFKTLFLATDPNQQLEDQLVKLRERIKEVSGNLQSLGSFGDPKLLNSLKEQERMLISQIGASVRLRGEEEKRKYLNAENAKYESAIASLRGNALESIEKETRKTQTLAEFRKSFINDKLKEAAKEKSVDIEKLKLNTDLMNVLQQQADIEYKKTQKSGGSKSENYYATLMREATNNTIAAVNATEELTKSELKLLEVKSDPRFKTLTSTQQAGVAAKYEGAIAAEKQTRATKELGDAEERLLAILGKSSGIGRKYYADLEAMEKDAKLTGKTREEIEELTRALFQVTPVWKAYEKALEDVNTASRKFQEDSLASQASVLQENRSLDHRLSLLGKTTEEQKALVIEYNRANKLREVDVKLAKQLREIEDKIAKAKKDGLKEGDYQSFIDDELQARKDAAEEQKVINREVAVQYREDFQKEFIDPIRGAFTDSIVTALFEGGKAGSKKLRDVLVSVLRQKVTMVVDVGVNAFMNSFLGGALGGSGVGGGGSAMNIASLGNSAFSLYSGLQTGLSGVVGSGVGSIFGTTAGNAALAQTLGYGSASSIAAAKGASIAGGGTGAGAGLGANLGAAAGPVAVALLALNALGAFKSERKVGGGLAGTLGSGNISPWEEWREGGTLFSGPKYDTFNPVAELDKAREKLNQVREAGDLRNVALQEMLVKNLEDQYGKLSESTTAQSKIIQAAYEKMRTSAGDMADTLGLSSDKVRAFTTQLGGEKGLNLEGLDAAGQQAKIAEALAKANNELAEQVLGTWIQTSTEISNVITTGFGQGEESGLAQSWETITKTIEGTKYVTSEYAKEGEKAIETLTRLATSFATVKDLWSDMRVDFDATGLAGADAASKIADAFGGLEAMTQQLASYIENYYSEAERKENLARRASEAFSRVGLSFSSDDILKATKPIIRGFVEGVLSEFGPSSPQYVAAIQQANLLAGIFEPIGETVSDALSKITDEVSRLYSARNTAGNLLDSISSAMGNKGTFSGKLESELWEALANTSDYEKQITLAGKLKDIILSRQTLEVENAKKLLDYGVSLRNYVNSLKIGALSPLTNGEKLAEAASQYLSTLEKAKAGDSDAKSRLQGISTSYLELARTYFAGNQQFESIFNSVTSSLDNLGIASVTEAEQQLAIGGQSLAELQKVYDVVSNAYTKLDEQYKNSLEELVATKDMLVLQSQSVKELKGIAEILSKLPAEISSLAGIGSSYFLDNPDVAKAYGENNYGLTEKEFSYEHYLKYGKDEGRSLPSFASGIDYVPYDMTANIHQGERVLTKIENRNYSKLTSAPDNSELIYAIKSLQAQVEKLEASNREDARMQAGVYVGASQAAADTIAAATTKAARTTELKQGATIK